MATNFDQLGWKEASSNLKQSFRRAVRYAEFSHADQVEIEHLLYALVDDAEAAVFMEKKGVDRASIQQSIYSLTHQLVSDFSTQDGEKGSIGPSLKLRKLLSHTSQIAENCHKCEIDGGDAMAAFLDLQHILGCEKLIQRKYVSSRRTQGLKAEKTISQEPTEKKEPSHEKADSKQDQPEERPEAEARANNETDKSRIGKAAHEKYQANKLLPSIGAYVPSQVKRKSKNNKKKRKTLPERDKPPGKIGEKPLGITQMRSLLPGRPHQNSKQKKQKSMNFKQKTDKLSTKGAMLPKRDILNEDRITAMAKLAEVSKRKDVRVRMNRTYAESEFPELAQVHQSLESLLAGRKKAEEALADCEWYDLLVSLGKVSDDLSRDDQVHRRELIEKAYEEIDRVGKWRKAIAYIQLLDREIEKIQISDEMDFSHLVPAEPEDKKQESQHSYFLDSRVNSLESHVRHLEHLLFKQKDKQDEETLETVGILPARPVVEKSGDDVILRTLQEKVTQLDTQNQQLQEDKHELEIRLRDLSERDLQLSHRTQDLGRMDTYKRENQVLTQKLRENDDRLREAEMQVELLKEKALARKRKLLAGNERVHSRQEDVLRLEQENRKLLEDIDTLSSEVRNKEADIIALNRRMEGLKSEIEVLRSGQMRNADMEQEIVRLKNDASDVQGIRLERDQLRRELDDARQVTRDTYHLKAERNRLKNEIQDLNAQVAEQQELKNKISTLHGRLNEEMSVASSLAEHQEKIASLEQDKNLLDQKAKRRKIYIGELEEQVEKLENRVRHVQKSDGEADLLRSQVNENRQYIEALEKDMALIKGQNTSLQSEKENILGQFTSLKNNEGSQLVEMRNQLHQEKEKSVTRERHVRALEQHSKALEAQLAGMRVEKERTDGLVETVGKSASYFTIASTDYSRDDDGLVEIIREVM